MAVKRYDGSAWQTVAGKGEQGTSSSISTWVKTASGGETSLSGNDDNSQTLSYTVGQELVFINGTLQKRGVDYTANNGTSITGLVALAANDVVTVWTVNAFSVTNAISNTLVDAKGDLVTATGADTPAKLSVGTNGQVLLADSTTATGLKWGTAGTTWTAQTSFGSSTTVNSIAYNGSNLYVAAGGSGVLYTSTDGKTWTSRTSGFGSVDINKVAYGNGLFVAVGNSGTITTSTDGVTWTARTSNMSTNEIRDVVYANSTWVAVGAGGGTDNTGGIIYSTDGTTWTRKSQSLTVGTAYYTVVWNGTNWVVGGTNSTNNMIYASTPSGTWTPLSFGAAQPVNALYNDGTRTFAAVGTNGFYQTTSSTMTSPTLVYGLPSINSTNISRYVALYSGKFYAAQTLYLQFSSTPVSDVFIQSSPTTLSPTAVHTSSGTTLTGAARVVHVNANGVIITDDYGRIYTSF